MPAFLAIASLLLVAAAHRVESNRVRLHNFELEDVQSAALLPIRDSFLICDKLCFASGNTCMKKYAAAATRFGPELQKEVTEFCAELCSKGSGIQCIAFDGAAAEDPKSVMEEIPKSDRMEGEPVTELKPAKELSQKGEACEGFDERKGEPFPSCSHGLLCQAREGGISIPGAGKVCAEPVKVSAAREKHDEGSVPENPTPIRPHRQPASMGSPEGSVPENPTPIRPHRQPASMGSPQDLPDQVNLYQGEKVEDGEENDVDSPAIDDTNEQIEDGIALIVDLQDADVADVIDDGGGKAETKKAAKAVIVDVMTKCAKRTTNQGRDSCCLKHCFALKVKNFGGHVKAKCIKNCVWYSLTKDLVDDTA